MMRALALIAVLVLGGCSTHFVSGGLGPQDALTIGFLQTQSLPTHSTSPGIAYSTGVSLSCTAGGGYVAFHADVRAEADTSTVRLAIAKVDATGNEAAVGSPAPITVVASEPPPTGLKTVIFKPIAMSELCATLSPGDYHARIVAPDGTVLAFGHFTIVP